MFQHFLKCHSDRINYDGRFHILKRKYLWLSKYPVFQTYPILL